MEWLAAGTSEIRLATVAQCVKWKHGEVVVEVTHADREETIRARALVITIPIGVWKANVIRFDPRLEEKERAIAKLEAGHVVKIIFRFRERFWEKDEFTFLHTNDPYMPTWWTHAPLRVPILTGWAGGHAADAMLAESPEARIDRALDSLARGTHVKRRTIDDLVIASYTHDYQSDPFSRCAYSYAGVGGSGAHRALARPIDGTLYFAGEATSSDETGTVAGAIESGYRAAREVAGNQ